MHTWRYVSPHPTKWLPYNGLEGWRNGGMQRSGFYSSLTLSPAPVWILTC